MSKKNRFNVGDEVLYSDDSCSRLGDLDKGTVTGVFYRRDEGKRRLIYEIKTTSPDKPTYVYVGERCLILYAETAGEELHKLIKAHPDLALRGHYWSHRTNRELINEFAYTIYKTLDRFFKDTGRA